MAYVTNKGLLNAEKSGLPLKKHSKARKTSKQPNNTTNEMLSENRELDRLKFQNPGKQMAELNFNWPEGNFTRNFHKQLVSRHHKNEKHKPSLYDSRGRLLGSLADTCDCLRSDCSGCHLPCRRCHSMYCGPVCRIYRTFCFNEVRIFI